MKKILLIFILLLTIGCKSEVKEVIKYRLSDKEKIVVELKEDSNLKYDIQEYFYIKNSDELIGSVGFLKQDECNTYKNDTEVEKVENKYGFVFKDENYHYLNSDNKICVIVNAKDLDNLNKILDNIDIRIEEEK